MRRLFLIVGLSISFCFFNLSGCSDPNNAAGSGEDTSADPNDSTVQPEDSTDELQCDGGKDTGLTDPSMSFENLDETRYCEVIIMYAQDDGIITGDVYNSLRFGNCPQELWAALDVSIIQEDFPDALGVQLNGPRYFLMQSMFSSPSQSAVSIHNFGGIRMSKVTTMMVNSAARNGYAPTTVNRQNTWRFKAGNRVHELIDAEGNIYTMQSFARIVDEDLSYDDLETLADRLSVPEGWRYRIRMLDEDLDVQAIDTATIIQDELKNTYQWRSDCQIQ